MFQLLFMSARMCVCNVYNMSVTVSLYSKTKTRDRFTWSSTKSVSSLQLVRLIYGTYGRYNSRQNTVDPSAAEYPPNSPKKHRWPKIRRKKMRLAENPPNRKFAAAAEKNRGYCGAFNTTGCCSL